MIRQNIFPVGWLAGFGVNGRDGTGCPGVGGTEDGGSRDAEGGGQMHGSAVVGKDAFRLA